MCERRGLLSLVEDEDRGMQSGTLRVNYKWRQQLLESNACQSKQCLSTVFTAVSAGPLQVQRCVQAEGKAICRIDPDAGYTRNADSQKLEAIGSE